MPASCRRFAWVGGTRVVRPLQHQEPQARPGTPPHPHPSLRPGLRGGVPHPGSVLPALHQPHQALGPGGAQEHQVRGPLRG